MEHTVALEQKVLGKKLLRPLAHLCTSLTHVPSPHENSILPGRQVCSSHSKPGF